MRQVVDETGAATILLDAGAYLFRASEYLAATPGAMNGFDRFYYPHLERICGRAFALAVSAGPGGENAVRHTARIARGSRLPDVRPPRITCTYAWTPAEIRVPKTFTESTISLP
ncbi:hypothetical protein [Tropicimonas marinistellae]|uniref:hypothetical protein n=1 Tax=Tropicimonas marinistellae TaxID=1739787 RepID=UPI0008369173|nr:hypothetical protein [Tropicimonas marinistellae]